MLVYRLSRKEEIDNILKNKTLENIGTEGKTYIKEEKEVNLNNHHYEENERYLHFFPNIEYILYINPEKDMYLCYYDIPDEILNKNLGVGEYKDYFILSIPRKIPEYSINIKDLDINYLEEIDLITDNICIEDYIEDETLSNFLEPVYTKTNLKNKK